jgi:hypothetical protein
VRVEIGRMMEYVAGRIRERQICTVTRGKTRKRERIRKAWYNGRHIKIVSNTTSVY